MKAILSGGGTGGHVYPAIAIADSLKKEFRDIEYLYVGVRGRAEEQIVPALGYGIRYVRGAGFSGNGIGPKSLLTITNLGIGLIQAAVILFGYKPDLIIGTGGYASVPAVLAAVVLRKFGLLDCRIFIHEQNFAPGRWNRMISRYVDRVWVSFEGTRRFLAGSRVEFTGYPVREQIVSMDRAEARNRLGIPPNAGVILAFGGSQGAKTINQALVASLPELLANPNIEVFHGYGAQRSSAYDSEADTRSRVEALELDPSMRSRYHGASYFHDIQTYYAAADLVICRGGAGTLNEICRCGRPALIIPKSNLAGEHQVVNSLALARNGAAEVILERPALVDGVPEALVDRRLLASTTLRLLADKEKLASMGSAALKLSSTPGSSVFSRSVRAELEGNVLSPSSAPVPHDEPHEEGLELTRLANLPPSRILAVAQRISGKESAEQVAHHPLSRILRYFADGYLFSTRWQVRNSGVKMTGLLRHAERRDVLISMVLDRTPDRWWKRLAGGDFRQVGFIRRNALTSLAALDIWDASLEDCLVRALTTDPYFEVRSEAAQVVLTLAGRIGASEKLCRVLQSNLDHKSPEVRWKCLEAAGAVAPEAGSIERFDDLIYHPNWRIRQALIKAVSHMIERGVVRDGSPILERIEQLIPTCTDFTPTFPLKRALNSLHHIAGALRGNEESRTTLNGGEGQK